METTMQKSNTIGKLAEALAAAQLELKPAKKESRNPFYDSKYADLGAIIEAVHEVLPKHGLAYTQLPTTDSRGCPAVTTMLLHTSGEYIGDTLSVPTAKNDAQSVGSALTYGRRYGLQAILGIAAEDDDGNAAVGGKKGKKEAAIECDECGEDVAPFKKPGGITATVQQIVDASIKKHGKTLCAQCQLDIAAIEKQERQPAKEVREPDGQTIMVAEVQETTKGYLKVKYHAPGSMGELEASLWDKKLWPLFDLPAGKKFVVKIETKESKGKTYNNIVDVLKVGEFSVEDGELVVHLTSKDTDFVTA